MTHVARPSISSTRGTRSLSAAGARLVKRSAVSIRWVSASTTSMVLRSMTAASSGTRSYPHFHYAPLGAPDEHRPSEVEVAQAVLRGYPEQFLEGDLGLE